MVRWSEKAGLNPSQDHAAVERDLPTPWSFVAPGVLAVLALIAAIAIPPEVHEDGYREHSMWSYGLFAFHVLAVLGCFRGSLVFLQARWGTLTWKSAGLMASFLAMVLGYVLLWALLIS